MENRTKSRKNTFGAWSIIQITFIIVLVCIAIYFAYHEEKKRHIPFGGQELPSLKPIKKEQKHNENTCRRIVQGIFGKPFPTIRPDWIRNPTSGKRLELDMYNETIITPLGKGLAFEYDGIQHSQYIPHFHRHGPEDFVKQCKRDLYKDQVCKNRGVLLIRIPHTVQKDDLSSYIKTQLSMRGLGRWV